MMISSAAKSLTYRYLASRSPRAFSQRPHGLHQLATLSAAALIFAYSLVAVGNPASDLLERDRIEVPLIVPTAIYSNDISFQSNPRFQSAYVGDPDRVIATSGSLQVSARELFCFLITAEHPAPTLIEGYDTAETRLEAESFRRQIRKAVRSYFATVRLAAAYRGPLSDIERKEIEILTFPAWQTAWTMRYIEPKIRLEADDLVRAYRKNRDLFFYPERVTFRALIVPFEQPDIAKEKAIEALPPEERDALRLEAQKEVFSLQSAAIDQLENIRQQIEAGELSFQAAASQLTDETGLAQGEKLPAAARGQLAPQLESVVFETTPGSLTPVIPIRNGAVLIQVENVEGARFAELEEVVEIAEELARRQATQFLFNRELDFVSPSEQTSDYRTWEKVEPNHVIIQVDDFTLTKEELLQLNPKIEDIDTFIRSDEELALTVKRLAMFAHIRREARRLGIANDPVINRSRRIAEWIVRSRRTLRERIQQYMSPDETRTVAFYETNPELFTPEPRYHLVQIGAITDENVPAQLAPEVSRLLIEDFIQLAREQGEGLGLWHRDPELVATEEAGRRLGLIKAPEYREGEADAYDYARPEGAYPYGALLPYSTEFVTIGDRTFAGDIYFEDLGYVFLNELEAHEEDLRGLEEREYGPVRLYDDWASSFYVIDIEQPETPAYEDVAIMAAQEYALQQRTLFVSRLLDTYEERAPINFVFEHTADRADAGK